MGAETVLYDGVFPLAGPGYTEIVATVSLQAGQPNAKLLLTVGGQVVDAAAVSVGAAGSYRLTCDGPLPGGDQRVRLTGRGCGGGSPHVAVTSFQRVPLAPKLDAGGNAAPAHNATTKAR